MNRRHETPIKRVNPSGKTRWVARYTNREGKTKSAGTFDLRREAQDAINAAYVREYAAPARSGLTVGEYAATWTDKHPRSHRTNVNYNHRLGRVLDVDLDGRALRDWPLADLRRRQVNQLIDHMLRVQGRAQRGAVGILRVLSAMWQDAIDDELAELNPFMGTRVKASDPRIVKAPRKPRVLSWPQMHAFARAAAQARTPLMIMVPGGTRREPFMRETGPSPMDAWRPVYAEAMVRVLSDCGLRLGELLALERADWHDGLLEVRRTAHEGDVMQGTKTDHGEVDAGRAVPVPLVLADMLDALPARIDSRLLFPNLRGGVWTEGQFYERIWRPARRHSGVDVSPHDMRHSWVSEMRAAGIDPFDLALVSGHTVGTANSVYTHPMGRSFDAVRRAVGE
jgi:integrase